MPMSGGSLVKVQPLTDRLKSPEVGSCRCHRRNGGVIVDQGATAEGRGAEVGEATAVAAGVVREGASGESHRAAVVEDAPPWLPLL